MITVIIDWPTWLKSVIRRPNAWLEIWDTVASLFDNSNESGIILWSILFKSFWVKYSILFPRKCQILTTKIMYLLIFLTSSLNLNQLKITDCQSNLTDWRSKKSIINNLLKSTDWINPVEVTDANSSSGKVALGGETTNYSVNNNWFFSRLFTAK